MALDELTPDLADTDPALRTDRWFAARLFGIVWLTVLGVSQVAYASLDWLHPHRLSPHAPALGAFPWLQAWGWWDGAWYVGIARHGYFFRPGHQSAVAFFPGYPLALRGLGPLLGGPLAAGVVLSVACGLGAVLLFHRWCRQWMASTEARYAVACLVVYPCAFYLMGAVYAEAMFVCASLAAFVFLEQDRPVAAGLAAALATATRSLGVAVVIGLWLRAHERATAGHHPETGASPLPMRRYAGLLLAPMGLLAYCGFLARRFGRPFAFIDAEAGWRQRPGPSTWSKVAWFHAMRRRPYLNAGHLHLLGHAAVTVVAICLVPVVFRHFGRAYGVYVAVLIAGAAISTKDFIGMGRYVLGAFPCFAVAGEAAARHPRAGRTAIAVSGCLLLLLSAVHARGTLVS